MGNHGSLPHRQLRKTRIFPDLSTVSSLPHRQLRKKHEADGSNANRSLPHRQLRNMSGNRCMNRAAFTAAQAA